jgi:hypothetical protein
MPDKIWRRLQTLMLKEITKSQVNGDFAIIVITIGLTASNSKMATLIDLANA